MSNTIYIYSISINGSFFEIVQKLIKLFMIFTGPIFYNKPMHVILYMCRTFHALKFFIEEYNSLFKYYSTNIGLLEIYIIFIYKYFSPKISVEKCHQVKVIMFGILKIIPSTSWWRMANWIFMWQWVHCLNYSYDHIHKFDVELIVLFILIGSL